MTELHQYLMDYGIALVFAVVLLEQFGLPLPSMIVLLGAGAMAGTGRMSAPEIVLVAVLASIGPNYFWFVVGRRKGARVLSLLCRLSLDSRACVRVTANMLGRLGLATLLVAKFVPGLNTLTPPALGIFGVPTGRFLAFNLAGTGLWASVSVAVGAVFAAELDRVVLWASRWGITMGVAAALLAGGWIAFKLLQRHWLLRAEGEGEDALLPVERPEPLEGPHGVSVP